MQQKRIELSPKDFYNKWLIIAALFTFYQYSAAQNFQRFDYLSVTENSRQLRYPWTGGVNSVQFAKADVNHDGKKDLFLYDKSSSRFCVFLAQSLNSTQYVFNAGYAGIFPEANGWMVLKDYNCDGIEDFFTYQAPGNIKVYAGYYQNDTLRFRLQQNGFFYFGSGIFINVYCSEVIKPTIDDFNKDGDLDVVSFNVSGNQLIYYENQQKELGLSCDSLFFNKTDNCWGNVFDTFSSSYALRDTCSFKFNRMGSNQEIMHTGSYIESLDADNNGVMDILIGSVGLNNMTLLYNNGTTIYASVLNQDTHYPSYDIPFNTSSFAAPVFLDVNNDGNKDLLVSTYDEGAANIENIWYYKNTRSDSVDLRFQQKDFILNDMIDVGENSNPCFMDVDGDGLTDILLGSGGLKDYINPAVYKLRFYKNTGTATYPAFTLQNDDFLNISTFGVQEISPASGDIDNDGDTDLVIGLSTGDLIYWENTAVTGNPPDLIFKGNLKNAANVVINIGAYAAPCIVDLNRDGKTDLIIGERNGNINYYSGSETGSIKFNFVTDSLGKIRIKTNSSLFGYTHPFITDVNKDGKYDLVLGTNLSGLQFYNNIEDKINDTFVYTSGMVSGKLGLRTTAVLADITLDGKLEMLTGNSSGGLIIFSEDPPPFQPVFIKNNSVENMTINLFPNPASNQIYINLPDMESTVNVRMFNLLGRQVYAVDIVEDNFIINTTHLSEGIYLLKVSDGKRQGNQKIVIVH